MKEGKLIKFCPDIGRYFVDASKIVLGSVVISPVIKRDFSLCTDGGMVIIGVITSLFMVISGILLININK